MTYKGNERGENSFWPTQIQRFSFFLVLIHMSCVIGSLETGSHILRKSDCTFSLFILDHMFKMWLKGMSQTHKSDLYCGQMNFFFGGEGLASQTMKGSNVSCYFIEIWVIIERHWLPKLKKWPRKQSGPSLKRRKTVQVSNTKRPGRPDKTLDFYKFFPWFKNTKTKIILHNI